MCILEVKVDGQWWVSRATGTLYFGASDDPDIVARLLRVELHRANGERDFLAQERPPSTATLINLAFHEATLSSCFVTDPIPSWDLVRRGKRLSREEQWVIA